MSKEKKVLDDSQVSGGKSLREVDHSLSENLGGYRAVQKGDREEPSFYGKWMEPVLHSAEHTRRAIIDDFNGKEWARAKDELKTTGSGLHTSDGKYQKEYTAEQEKQKNTQPK